ncbi:MAG: hypothetical protein AVDCRST_MAG38-2462 [uncultured Solirubrobacteraceae bacterium]|uniref:UspA domain-containing protein n=1 Tax=uncultured Solirubrobacteraceae bacterium TaxID=1162706 RepID=A0A6J4S2S0_9ACTN|nr:MAG: hypothetical protein AVDCRST_MAG38-2462 [uncultured Solirubrobacteraceae bacterium]
MVRPIVIGAHPKRDDRSPLELGVTLSRLTGAPLQVVGSYWFDSTPGRTAQIDYGRELERKVRHAVARVLGAGDLDSPVDVRVTCGSPAHALQQTATELGAGMIVVGSTHRGAFGRMATGTTAERVLDGAPCPVAVAPSGLDRTWGQAGEVGVAFVDTPGGWSALRAGAAMARGMGAQLAVYTVTDAQTDDSDQRRAEDTLERAIAEVAGDLGGEARILEGGAPALIKASKSLDLLVRGCRSPGVLRRPLSRELPGKLAGQLGCPLVVVGPGKELPLVSMFDAEAALPA